MKRNLVTAKELAEYLKVNKITVYRWDKQGKIKNYGIGLKKLYDLNEINDNVYRK